MSNTNTEATVFSVRKAPIVEQLTDETGTITGVKLSLDRAKATGPYSFQELSPEEASSLAAELTAAAS